MPMLLQASSDVRSAWLVTPCAAFLPPCRSALAACSRRSITRPIRSRSGSSRAQPSPSLKACSRGRVRSNAHSTVACASGVAASSTFMASSSRQVAASWL